MENHRIGPPAILLASVVLLGAAALAGCYRAGDSRPREARVTAVAAPLVTASARAAIRTATPTPSPTAAPSPTATPPLAARVNGQPILLSDFDHEVEAYQEALRGRERRAESVSSQAAAAEIRRYVLESLIDLMLVEQGAARLGVSVSEAALEAQVEADVAAGGGEAEFEVWLRATGQTREDYTRSVAQSLLLRSLMDAVATDLPIEAEQVHARWILMDSKEHAVELLAELREGADFGALAKEWSLDAATRELGGDLGWFPRGLRTSELEHAAFDLQPGEISQVVSVGGAYAIIQVLEREKARRLLPEIQMALRKARFQRWLDAQRARAEIERFIGE